jgi:hypothetical protein
MIDERYEDLMWQQIDGEISPEDRAKLDEHRRENAEADGHYKELVGISEAIAARDELEPPAALRPRIDEAIDWGRYAPKATAPSTGWLQRFFPRTGWDLRLVPVAAAAFVLGIVGYQLLAPGGGSTPSIDASHFYGAMAPKPDAKGVSRVEIDLDAVRGTVGFREDGDVTVSEITLTSDREVEVRLEFEGESLEFGALGQTDSPLQDISLSDNVFSVKNLGANKYYFVFRSESGQSSPVQVRILDSGAVLLEEVWTPDQ